MTSQDRPDASKNHPKLLARCLIFFVLLSFTLQLLTRTRLRSMPSRFVLQQRNRRQRRQKVVFFGRFCHCSTFLCVFNPFLQFTANSFQLELPVRFWVCRFDPVTIRPIHFNLFTAKSKWRVLYIVEQPSFSAAFVRHLFKMYSYLPVYLFFHTLL